MTVGELIGILQNIERQVHPDDRPLSVYVDKFKPVGPESPYYEHVGEGSPFYEYAGLSRELDVEHDWEHGVCISGFQESDK